MPPIDRTASVESVRLVPYLEHHYGPALLASVANRPRNPSSVPAPATGTEEEVWGLSWIVL